MDSIKQLKNGKLPISSPEQNHLLSLLPPDVLARLAPYLQLVQLPLGQCLYESGEETTAVFFPTNSVISLIGITEDGDCAEISVVGHEGVLGIAVFMGGESTPNRAIVQSAGSAYQLPGKILKKEFNRHTELHELLLRYAQSLMTQLAQTAVCNRHHSIEQQLCRWLLSSLDRIPSNTLTMTQELIANMLGVRRAGVAVAAGKLQKLGVIEYQRGKLVILSRPELERLSCECYEVVKVESDRLLSFSPAHSKLASCI